MQPLRFGIYGSGSIARDFARALESSKLCQLVHVCARREEAARALAEDFDARWSSNLDDVVGDETVDAVYVATSHPFHEAPTLRALEAGKDVLCEKPLAPSAEAVARMLD